MQKLVALLIIVFTATCSSAADIVLKPGNLAVVLEQARKASKPVRIVVADGVHPITGWQKAEGGLWKAADYLLFSSLADRETADFIDNLKPESLTK